MVTKHIQKRWVISQCDAACAERLVRELNISARLARLLAGRGITDPAAAHRFLNPSITDLHDPFLMRDMRQAVERIMRAVSQKEKILVYGDYDVDGTTSTVILKTALAMIGAEVSYYIPERRDGYGLRQDAFDRARAEGIHLIISVDTGIRARAEVEHARRLGLDIIITDHHLPEEGLPDKCYTPMSGQGRLPQAVAVLNPRRSDCSYPDKNLAGVGVTFKLVEALLRSAGRSSHIKSFIKIAAIGTIADMVPLIGENRIIAKCGLEGLSRPGNAGLRALLSAAGIAGRAVTSEDISFRIAPLINAAGRMSSASAAVDLFDAPDFETAKKKASELCQQNAARQRAEAEIIASILAEIERDPALDQARVVVMASEGWHRGVIGIAASKVVEQIGRPAIIISIEGELGHGSGRSIPAFHLLEGLAACADLFERFGGHSHAAGLVLRADRIGELRRRLNEYAEKVLSEEDMIPAIAIDSYLPLSQAVHETIEETRRLEPFGTGNPKPVFSAQAQVVSNPRVLKNKHLKLRVREGSRWIDCLWWGEASRAPDIFPGDQVSLAFTLSENTWSGRAQVELELLDLKILG
jgi:single-stranded-DNA-specific exonuclease